MNSLLLFTQTSVEKQQADPERLTSLLNQADPESIYDYAFFEDLLFFISNERVEVIDTRTMRDISSFDCVYFRYWGEVQALALATSRYCAMKNVPLVDEEVLRKGSYNKLNQNMNLRSIGLPIPNTLIARSDLLLAHYKNYFQDFPILIKAVNGTRGSDNFVINSHDELKEKLQAYEGTMFTMQAFVPNEGDYRVIVMGDSIPMVIMRKAKQGTHLNNTSQGGSAVIVDATELPDEVRDQAIKAAEHFGRTIAGVDVMQSSIDGKYYFLEVNRSPQIENSSFEAEKAQALTAFLHSRAKKL